MQHHQCLELGCAVESTVTLFPTCIDTSTRVLRHRVAPQPDGTSTLLQVPQACSALTLCSTLQQDLVRWVVFKESRRKLKASAPRISHHQATRVAMEDAFKNFIMMYQHRLEKAFTQIGHKSVPSTSVSFIGVTSTC